jgi:anaerobic magnesium-protoporphyrin IX monomethyl ester cyclase
MTMLELADCLIRKKGRPGDIRGLFYRDEGGIRATPERPLIPDPDVLPFPARELFPLPMYESPGQVLMSRGGCPFNCPFCAVNTIWKGARRFRSPENVVREILHVFGRFGFDEISFADDTFTLNRDLVVRLCGLSSEIRAVFPWRWKCTTRVDRVDRDLLKRMRGAGCYGITFGVEAGSQKILDTLGKRITPGQVRNAVRASLDSGLEVLCSFMFPHPEDTEETIREQKRFMKELVDAGATVSLAFTTPLPGTDYYDRAEERGIRLLTDRWEEFDAKHLLIATRILSEEKLAPLLEELLREVGMRPSSPLPA